MSSKKKSVSKRPATPKCPPTIEELLANAKLFGGGQPVLIRVRGEKVTEPKEAQPEEPVQELPGIGDPVAFTKAMADVVSQITAATKAFTSPNEEALALLKEKHAKLLEADAIKTEYLNAMAVTYAAFADEREKLEKRYRAQRTKDYEHFIQKLKAIGSYR